MAVVKESVKALFSLRFC